MKTVEVRTSRRKHPPARKGVIKTSVVRPDILTARSPLFRRFSGEDRSQRGSPNDICRWAVVHVSVGNIRKKIGHEAELGTQVLMGAVLKVWKSGQEWLRVQTPENYFGWITGNSVTLGGRRLVDRWNAAKKVIVTEMEDQIRERPNPSSWPVCDAVAGMLLEKNGKIGRWLKVELPDHRTGFLKAASAVDYETWKSRVRATPETIEQTAKTFFGRPYLWGGTSAKAVDCSGFIQSVFFLNGVQLNRDAREQAKQGTAVASGKKFEKLRKGDLLFFSDNPNGKRPVVTHVALYLHDQTFIHSSGWVRLNSFDRASPLFDAHRRKTFVGARRIL